MRVCVFARVMDTATTSHAKFIECLRASKCDDSKTGINLVTETNYNNSSVLQATESLSLSTLNAIAQKAKVEIRVSEFTVCPTKVPDNQNFALLLKFLLTVFIIFCCMILGYVFGPWLAKVLLGAVSAVVQMRERMVLDL